jgi:DNA-binding MarR family transcriptional regulator
MMKTVKISSHTESTVLQFLETAFTLERKLDRALSYTKGISFSEYRLLNALSMANANGVPRIELAQEVGLTASAVTRALKPLTKLGYVATERSARDARQSLTKLTAGGQELLSHAKNILQDTLREMPINTLAKPKVDEFRIRLSELRSK